MAPPLLNPYEEEQQVILSRILGTVEKLNESMLEANKAIEQVNNYNSQACDISELWTNYMRDAQVTLRTMGQFEDPK